MNQKARNALLPPMDEEDFKDTYPYCLLAEDSDYRNKVCNFLYARALDDLEFVANPDCGYYTQYD